MNDEQRKEVLIKPRILVLGIIGTSILAVALGFFVAGRDASHIPTRSNATWASRQSLHSREPYMKLDLQAGIFRMEDKMPGLIVTNYWNQVIQGEWVSVLAGAAPRYTEDGREKLGPAGLWLWYQTEGQYD